MGIKYIKSLIIHRHKISQKYKIYIIKNIVTCLDIYKVQDYSYVLKEHDHNFITNLPNHVIYVFSIFQVINKHSQIDSIVISHPSPLILIAKTIQIVCWNQRYQ